MSDITLTSGIRQNLLALQQTSADLNTTQEALSTGKAVNSASDNPSAYFTSQTLTNNANALSALLDQIGQGSQTISAADNGLTGVTSLLQQALSTATQAQQSATGTLTYSAITGTGTIGADSTQVTGNTFSTTGLTAATLSATTSHRRQHRRRGRRRQTGLPGRQQRRGDLRRSGSGADLTPPRATLAYS